MILFNPGPVNVSARVRSALIRPDLCHRESEFSVLQESVRQGLLAVYGLSKERYASVLLTGSGTAAVEAMITSLIPQSGKLLILENGDYGERIEAMPRANGISFTAVKHEWGAELNAQRIEESLQQDTTITHVGVIHHETTTGRLNDLKMVSELTRVYGKVLLVDGVSSFGGEELNFEEWNIGAVCATANKCLHGIPGISFAIVRRELLEQTDFQPRSVYLNLREYYREQEHGGTPFTSAIQVMYALEAALNEFHEQGGWIARHERYKQLAQHTRTHAQELGIKMYLEGGVLAYTLTAFYLPTNISYAILHDHVKRAGFVIYAGQGEAGKVMFRIANMGEIEKSDIDRLFIAIKELL